MTKTAAKAQWFLVSKGDRYSNDSELTAKTGLRITLTANHEDASTYRLEVKNSGSAPIEVERLGIVLSLPVPEGDWRVFLDGGTLTWAGVRPLANPDSVGTVYAVSDRRHLNAGGEPIVGHRSNMTTVLHETAGKSPALLVSFLGQSHGSNYIDVWPDETGHHVNEIEAWGEFATRPIGGSAVPSPLELMPGESLALDPLVICQGSSPLVLLETLGDRVHARYGRTFDEPPIVGLMTWYARYAAVDEKLVAENLPIIADLFNGYPQPMRNIMIIDDGWQQGGAWGTIQADAQRFSHGLSWLASQAREHGVELGIWLSTTHVTNIGGHFPPLEPMMVRDASGKLISSGEPDKVTGKTAYVPDAARSDVQQWWRNQIRELSEIGARYFKLDFFATRTSERDRSLVSLRSMMDSVWDAFRQSCPTGTHLAACSCDTNLQLGRCDSIRIGTDIGEAGFWPVGADEYRKGLSSIASMWFKQRRFWVNDPDRAQVSNGCSLGEARVRATAVAFCGGHVMAGEDLRLASPERLEMLRRLIPVYPVAARPLDLFEQPFPGGYPAVWSLPVPTSHGERKALALFNVDSKARRFTVTSSMLNIAQDVPFVAIEWWQSRNLGEHTGSVEIEVPAYDVAVLHASATADHPVLISLSHHYTGWYIVEDFRWNESSLSLQGTLVTKKGLPITLFGHAPKSYRLTTEGSFSGISGPGGNWQYTLQTQGHRTPFEIPFRKR